MGLSRFSPSRQLAGLRRAWHSRPIAGQVGWVIIPFGIQQIVRLATQVALAYLLAPEIFGVMLLVNTLRTGAELLSDIGIGQSVVRSPRGDSSDFLRVAWTLQVLRGALLTCVMGGLSWPIAQLYDKPELIPIILAVSPVFLISGFLSPSLFVIQKRMNLKARAAYDIITVAFQCAITVGLAAAIPSVWALVWGLVVSSLFSTAVSYFFGERFQLYFTWNRSHVAEIFDFGKWIFLSTTIYFAATSFDRAYVVGAVSLTIAGVFAISRTFSDLLGSLAQRVGGYLVFPKVAAMQGSRPESAPRLRRLRSRILAIVALAIGLAIATVDQFILLAYDERYHGAAFMIPILLFSVWFGILSSFADSMLMGSGRPAPGAWANGGKFVVLLVGLPFSIAEGSLVAALGVLVLAEAARWLALVIPSQLEGFARIRDDVFLTLLVLLIAFGSKEILGFVEIVPTVYEWWTLRTQLNV